MLRLVIARGFARISPLRLFRERELLFQCTQNKLLDDDGFAESVRRGNAGKCSAYCGYDPSSDSLHLGNLVSIIMMGRLAQIGIDPVFLIGGATGMIGDPSGKSKQRNLLNQQEVTTNLKGITRDIITSYENILRLLNSGNSKYGQKVLSTRYEIVNNVEFYRNLNVITFLRDIGKSFRVNALLAKESVTKRIQSTEGISYAEFSYGLLQAYDFAVLREKYGCVLQIGGSDQWGNITNGCDYIRKTTKQEVHAITMPLLVTATGEKFGKSQGNALFLNPTKTPLSTIYQYLMSTPDSIVKRYLRILTCLRDEQIEEICQRHSTDPEKRIAQKALCEQICLILAGDKGFQNPHELFYKEGDLRSMSLETLNSGIEKLDKKDVFDVQRSSLSAHRDLIDLLSSLGIGKSKAQLRRQVGKGGLYLNNLRLLPEQSSQPLSDLLSKQLIHDRYLIVRLGKKHYKVIRLS